MRSPTRTLPAPACSGPTPEPWATGRPTTTSTPPSTPAATRCPEPGAQRSRLREECRQQRERSGRGAEDNQRQEALLSRHHHDALFRQVFSDRAEGAGLLRLVLPEHLLGRLRLGTLRLRSESFVDEDLASRQADLLYSVQSEEGPCLVYVLFEHQSTVDASMPFRMLRYVLEVQRQEAKSRGRGELLPAV
ncbi:MAG TPA: Rpn family recombination-promoting nuclease/putative transposase, partial [Acidobacteria bacterium]|nr:Rpn family recombination-promoting nuclease/putative transposase [Acidobacteriota bacterium]